MHCDKQNDFVKMSTHQLYLTVHEILGRDANKSNEERVNLGDRPNQDRRFGWYPLSRLSGTH